ncbi:MAG: hypothetical protein A4E65_00150 [Syntrophorhabdus sp. PtaU1.Bin153]|nr:MAG: hypothetical protein A4E65_00150 [Syntrophorhabdus sp. PtaU1.Bin153]
MSLVDNNGEGTSPLFIADLVQDKGKLLYRGDNDLLAALNEVAKISGMFGVPHRGAHLGELFDRITDLLVKDTPVGNDDDRLENRSSVFCEADKLMGEPSNGIRFPAARRVLNKVPLARTGLTGIREQATDYIELMIARPYLRTFLLSGFLVSSLYDLGVILDNVCQTLTGQDTFPEIVRL